MVVYLKDDIDAIVFELKNNKTLLAPTDTVPGLLSIDKNNIYKIKSRSKSKKIILFISSIEQINESSLEFKNFAKKVWPSNLTIIKNNISYRMPNNEFLLSLIDKICRPLYCSSANISGQNIVKNLDEAKSIFSNWGTKIIFLDDKFVLNKPSTIYDYDKDKIIREGDITYEQIKQWKN